MYIRTGVGVRLLLISRSCSGALHPVRRQMKRLLLVEPDETVRRELGAYLRSDGHEVLEIDKQRALELCQERVDAVFVWSTREAARAAAVLREMDGSPQPHILFYAASESAPAREATAPAPALVGETTAMRDLRAT